MDWSLAGIQSKYHVPSRYLVPFEANSVRSVFPEDWMYCRSDPFLGRFCHECLRFFDSYAHDISYPLGRDHIMTCTDHNFVYSSLFVKP